MMDDERIKRMRYRLEHFGVPILSEATIDRMCSRPRTVEDDYLEMHIEKSKPRQRDDNGVPISRRQVKKALAEIRADLGYPDFRHKMWKDVV